MTQPLRVDCPSAADTPDVERLRGWATDEQHVVLQFPPAALADAAKKALIRNLGAALPECRVFDSGGSQNSEWVTVMRVVRTEDVSAHLEGFVAALRVFRQTATTLAHRLAERLQVSPDQLLDHVWRDDDSVAPLEDGWVWQPHGSEC